MKRIIMIILLLGGASSASAFTGINGTVSGEEYCIGICAGVPFPLSGALISSNSGSTITDASGDYSLNLSAGFHNVTVSKLPEYSTEILYNVSVTTNNTTTAGVSPTLTKRQTGIITGTVTTPCIPALYGGCYSGYEYPYTLFTIPYYSGESVQVITGGYDDVLMIKYPLHTDFVEVSNDSVYTFQKNMISAPIRIYSNSSIAVVHKRNDQHVYINPMRVISENIHNDINIINDDSLNIVQELGGTFSIDDFGYEGRFNV